MYRISPRRLEVARGRLMAALGRDVDWTEFAKMAGLTIGTISNVRHKRTAGSGDTAAKIVTMLRANGVVITHDDLLEEVETGASRHARAGRENAPA